MRGCKLFWQELGLNSSSQGPKTKLGDALGATEIEETRVRPVRVWLCVGEGQDVFISSGVWQVELSDVAGDTKKELSSRRSSKE